MRTNYILIDYENVQPASLAGLDADHFRVRVFVGANQNKLNYETVAAMQPLGPRAEYVKITGNGANALDFHIAFHIGQLAAQDSNAYFHIISKDAGFDPLIQHLKKLQVLAARWNDVADIPLLKAANAKNTPERIEVIVAKLRQLGCCKPKSLKTLTSTINAQFANSLTPGELKDVTQGLQAQGIFSVNDDTVVYRPVASPENGRCRA